jgi:hypothetical protein
LHSASNFQVLDVCRLWPLHRDTDQATKLQDDCAGENITLFGLLSRLANPAGEFALVLCNHGRRISTF